MNGKVVLPDFTFPAAPTHPAVRAVSVAAGLLVAVTLILGAAVWRQTALQAAARTRVAPAVAVMQVAAVPAQPAPVPAAAVVAAPAAADGPASEITTMPAAKKPVAHLTTRHHPRHRAVKSFRARTLAKGSPADRTSMKTSARKDDAIDRLLKQFK